MRARQPDRTSFVERDGVRIAYDVYGEQNSPTVVLSGTWAIADAHHWKAQVPVLARRYRVITMDGRGSGRSDKPTDAAANRLSEHARDVVAVMDATDTQRAVVAGVSNGGVVTALVAAAEPERVSGAILIAPALGSLAPRLPGEAGYSFTDELDVDEDWALFNQHAWRRDLPKFAHFFWSQVFTEPHSTKHIEDGVGWTAATNAEVLIATAFASDPVLADRDKTIEMLRSIRCPVLVVHGVCDAIVPFACGEVAAEATGGDLLVVEGAGHCPQGRDPIRINRALIEFIERVTPPAERASRRTTWTRALDRPKRVLYLSSPIGLGHARRDLAIAKALRERDPAVQVDWLAQEPVTTFLAGTAETVHPASSLLASESAHVASEAHEHDLHAFQAVRRMDEILVANFSVFQDVVDSGDYDLVIGDEAWDVDHFWHENPELKRSAFAWLTDFVGWLPMSEGGAAEAALTADYNAEMLEHIERFRRVRDRAIFIGDPDDVVTDAFGPGLPSIRDWTVKHYDFTGYVTGFDPAAFADRERLKAELGFPADQPLVVVTVGGSGVGTALLRKVVDAYPVLREALSGVQVLAVAGPRIDPASLPAHDGVDIRGYVPDLHRYLAACDAAIVQGGLTTTMELVANRRPFVYFPLGQHFEQQRHVRHRLDRHGAGACMDYNSSDAESIATAVVEQIKSPCDYIPVPRDGADRAADLLAQLL